MELAEVNHTNAFSVACLEQLDERYFPVLHGCSDLDADGKYFSISDVCCQGSWVELHAGVELRAGQSGASILKEGLGLDVRQACFEIFLTNKAIFVDINKLCVTKERSWLLSLLNFGLEEVRKL